MKRFTFYAAAAALSVCIFTSVSAEAASESKTDLDLTVGILADLHKYYGNTFVWQKKALQAGQVCSRMIPQIPIKMYDGTVVNNKSVKVCRGDMDKDGDFVLNKNGGFVKIDLYTEKMYDAGSIMMLTDQGAGAAASCWKGGDGPVVAAVPKYNCFFRIQPASDGGVLLRWTMYHPGAIRELKAVDPIKSILEGTSTDLKVRPSGLELPDGSTFEIE